MKTTHHRPHYDFTVLASLLGLAVLCFIPTLLAGSLAAGGLL
jgi:hypothetical protein